MTRKQTSLSVAALCLSLCLLGAQAQKPAAHGKKPTASAAPPTKAQINSALITAILQRSPEQVRDLLKRGADPNTISDGNPALGLAAMAGPKELLGPRLNAGPPDIAMVGALLDAGAKVDAVNKLGRTPLAKSITDSSGKICELLLEHHASVDLADKHGVTPLMLAAAEGRGHVMDILLAHNARTEAGQNPLVVQIINQSEGLSAPAEFTRFIGPLRDAAFLKLVAQGADINAKTDGGDSVLAIAILRNNMNYVPFLLDRGANINEKNKDNITPLLYAAHNGKALIVRYLLAHGADPKVVGPDGITALHLGVEQGNFAIVEMLLQKGVDLSPKNAAGKTPLALACEKKLTGIINQLTAAGAKE